MNKSRRQHPHKAPTIRPPASHHENYPGKTNQTYRSLLGKHGRVHKWCTPMDPLIWPGKSRTTSSNIHPVAMWGYGMCLWRPARGDERWGEVAREGQGYPFLRHDIIIIIIIHSLELFTSALADGFSLDSEWQQVSSSLQDSSQYSSRSQYCCRLGGLHPSANFQVLQSL